jgi:hypothetical protein
LFDRSAAASIAAVQLPVRRVYNDLALPGFGWVPEWVGRVFFARFDERATWLDDLQPAFGEPEFFFDALLRERAACAQD